MNNASQTMDIDIVDILCAILKKTTIIIGVSIIFVVVALAYAVFTNHRASSDPDVNNIMDIDNRLSGESDEEFNTRVINVNNINNLINNNEVLYSQLTIQNNYVNNSLIMQIDPLATHVAEVQVVITCDEDEPSGRLDALVSAYEARINSVNYINETNSLYDCDAGLVGELILCDHEGFQDNSVLLVGGGVTRTIDIKVIGASTDFVDSIMDDIIVEIDLISQDLSSQVADHSVMVVNRQTYVSYIQSVEIAQTNAFNRISDIQNKINSNNGQLDTLAKLLGFKDRNDIYGYSADVVSSNRVSYIKTGFIGFVLGFAIMVGFYMFQYLFGCKVLSQRQFFCEFPYLNKVGICKPQRKRSRIECFFDRITGDDTNLSDDIINRIIVANYRNITENNGKYLITGTIGLDILKDTIDKMGISGDVKPCMFESPDILNDLSSYDGVLLVEQRAVSLKKSVSEQAALIKNSGKPIIGVILL